MFSWMLQNSPKTFKTSNIFWSVRQVLAFPVKIHEFSCNSRNDWSELYMCSRNFWKYLELSESLWNTMIIFSFLFASWCFSKSSHFSEHLLTIPTCSGFVENFGNLLHLVLIFERFSEATKVSRWLTYFVPKSNKDFNIFRIFSKFRQSFYHLSF